MSVKKIPEGYRNVTPYLSFDNAAEALDYYEKVFGAKVRMKMPRPDGKIAHAEIELGDSLIMLADACPEMGNKSAKSLGGSPIGILLYVDDVDSVFARAVASGAKSSRAVENKFYGDRSGTITDPFGYDWHLSTHVEDVSEDEMQRRMAAMNKAA